MRIAYLECFSGISGDMLLAALLDAGVSEQLLREAVAKLDLGAELRISRVDRSGISATKVDVLVNGLPAEPEHHQHNDKPGAGQSAHSHSHSKQTEPAGHSHSDADGHSSHTHHEAAHQHGRTLSEIRRIIQRAPLAENARQTALRAFDLLGEAEAKIHQVPIETIHFHEVGGVDAIVDIICSAVGSDSLAVDQWFCSPVNVGSGTVSCAHGVFPVPAPATLELLRELPIYSSGAQSELATPTGAALLRALACQPTDFPAARLSSIGYGAGSRNPKGAPNVLRLSIGESSGKLAKNSFDHVTVLETAVDDLNPQVLGYVSEQLLAEGALDVFIVPTQMKKNRPGALVTVLCEASLAPRMREILFSETTTLGIRTREDARAVLDRRIVAVPTQWGDVRVKEAYIQGKLVKYAPEYEDCRRIAAATGLPLREVQQAITDAYLTTHPGAPSRAK